MNFDVRSVTVVIGTFKFCKVVSEAKCLTCSMKSVTSYEFLVKSGSPPVKKMKIGQH